MLVIASVVFLFSMVHGHSRDIRFERTSCIGNADAFSDAWLTPWCTGGGGVLEALDLNEGQRERVEALWGKAVDRSLPFRERHNELKERLVEGLKAEEVNQSELFRIRSAYLELLDQASGSMLEGMIELAEVLTPEQRVALMARVGGHSHRQ
ncbi:MAG: Spy/CpxP family protein refolding chaperone [Desulfobacteraceae bacterium]